MLADFDPSQIGHYPIDDHQSRMMLRKKVDRFAPTLREDQGVLFLGQRVLDELAGNG